MRRLLLALAFLPVVVASAPARSAPPPSLKVAGPIVELKADAGRAIALVRSDSQYGCPDILVWSPSAQKTVVVVDHSRWSVTGCLMNGPLYGVAVAGDTAAWVRNNTGNSLETALFVKPLPGGRDAESVAEGAAEGGGDSGTFVTQPYGDGGLLVYTKYARCQRPDHGIEPQVTCPPGYPAGATSSAAILTASPPRRAVAIADHDLRVLAVGGGRIVARLETGGLIVLAPTTARAPLVDHDGVKAERLVATYPYKPRKALAAATDGHTLAVLRAGALDVIPLPGTRGSRSTRRVPYPGTRLDDVDGNVAVYTRHDAVYLLDLTTGRSVIFARPTAAPITAQLEPDGLYLAAGTTLTFTPRDQVEQRLHR